MALAFGLGLTSVEYCHVLASQNQPSWDREFLCVSSSCYRPGFCGPIRWSFTAAVAGLGFGCREKALEFYNMGWYGQAPEGRPASWIALLLRLVKTGS